MKERHYSVIWLVGKVIQAIIALVVVRFGVSGILEYLVRDWEIPISDEIRALVIGISVFMTGAIFLRLLEPGLKELQQARRMRSKKE